MEALFNLTLPDVRAINVQIVAEFTEITMEFANNVKLITKCMTMIVAQYAETATQTFQNNVTMVI